MITGYRASTINKELKELLNTFKDSYRTTCYASRVQYMKTLPAGSQIPKEGVIYGDAEKQQFKLDCKGFRDKANKILSDAHSELKKEATEAPSTEAVNSVALLNMRKDITETEIEDLINRYGDNPQVWKTIRSIAGENGIRVSDHPINEQIRNIEGLMHTLNSTLSVASASKGHAGDGFLSMVAMQIDDAFPVEG